MITIQLGGTTIETAGDTRFLSEAMSGIIVVESLLVQLTYTSLMRADTCRIDNPSFVQARMFIDPGGPAPFLSINNHELFGGACLGDHVFSKTATPLGPASGNFTLRLEAAAASVNYPPMSITMYPGVRVWADGRLVIDVTYPSPGGARAVSDSWAVVWRPTTAAA